LNLTQDLEEFDDIAPRSRLGHIKLIFICVVMFLEWLCFVGLLLVALTYIGEAFGDIGVGLA
jgi:hypothetical protein